jgi:putative flippase GtrA
MHLLRELGTQFIKFAGVGLIGTVGHYSVLVALVDLAGADPVLASTLGFITGAIINYRVNHKFTFNSSASHKTAAPKFLSVALIGVLVNITIMYLLVSIFLFYYLIAQIAATGIVLIWNFLGNRLWTFRVDSVEDTDSAGHKTTGPVNSMRL